MNYDNIKLINCICIQYIHIFMHKTLTLNSSMYARPILIYCSFMWCVYGNRGRFHTVPKFQYTHRSYTSLCFYIYSEINLYNLYTEYLFVFNLLTLSSTHFLPYINLHIQSSCAQTHCQIYSHIYYEGHRDSRFEDDEYPE